jgi:Holliday junction DNA helicase RuvB
MSGLLNSPDYPETWDDYIGQEKAKKALMLSAHAAYLRKENHDHLLISSLPGMGKTALVQLVCRELDRTVHVITGALNLAKARMLFSMVEKGDIVFWDEFHKCLDSGIKNAEWLLHYLQDGVLLTPFGQEEVPAVTFIGATTEKGALPESITSRFTIIDLQPYTDAEAATIITTMSTKVLGAAGLPALGKDAAVALSAAALNHPRMMRKLLNAVRDLAVVGAIEVPEDGEYDVSEALDVVDVTHDGLNRDCREYLRIMYVEMGGEPTGEALLRRRTGIVGKGIYLVERTLQDKGFTGLTKGGRMLTGPGFKRCKELYPDHRM